MLIEVITLILALSLDSASALEVSGNTVTIHNASDFIELSDNVNNKSKSYYGSTVLLAADLDFTGLSDKFNPIGTDQGYTAIFRGVFDGQGHTISNLAVNSSLGFVAPFGIVGGPSFKDLVVDSSCSVLSTHVSDEFYFYVSGIVSAVYLYGSTPSIVEGCVNMASVEFAGNYTGNVDSAFSIGGVVGFFYSETANFLMRNCVNYGTITFSGVHKYTSIGGVLGAFFDPELVAKRSCELENCANYGRLIHNGETKNMISIAGISGVILKGRIENCIDYGTYKSNQIVTAGGKMSGAGNNGLTLNNCFWTDEADANAACGFKYGTEPKTTNTYHVESNTTTMDTLNAWVSSKGGLNHTKWMMLHLNGGKMGLINEDVLIVPQRPFPDPVKEGHSFAYWCTDPECLMDVYNGTFEDFTELYAEWEPNNYTVTFDFGDGTFLNMSFTFNTTIVYPAAPSRKGFYGWNSSIERMPGHDLVIGPSTTPPPPKEKKSNAGAIAGGVIGGVVLIVLIALLVLFFLLRYAQDENGGISMRALERDGVLSMRGIWKRSGGGAPDRREAGKLGRGGALRRGGALEQRGIGRRTGEDCALRGRGADGDSSGDLDGSSEFVTSTAFTDTLYPEPYRIPTMMEALTEAGIGDKGAKLLVEFCEDVGKDAVKDGNAPDGFTEADAAAVAMYTFDFDPEENEPSPYELINKALMRDGGLESVRGVLYLVLCALRKLPRCEDRLLYRSLRGPVDAATYKKGSIVMWPAIVSTSPDMGAIKKLISGSEGAENPEGENGGEDGEEKNAGSSDVKGTLFVIENGWGYNIQPYSMFPDDGEEILLEPERRFQVDSVIPSADVVIVNLKMLDTPLVLPQVFGDNSK